MLSEADRAVEDRWSSWSEEEEQEPEVAVEEGPEAAIDEAIEHVGAGEEAATQEQQSEEESSTSQDEERSTSWWDQVMSWLGIKDEEEAADVAHADEQEAVEESQETTTETHDQQESQEREEEREEEQVVEQGEEIDPNAKEVSAQAMQRLNAATRAISYTKQVISSGAGNQKEALQDSNFNSYFRMATMRDPDCWEIDPAVMDLAAKYPDALTAAKADLAGGGNCGEHAMLAFDYLRQNLSDAIVNRCDVTGLDHAFVIIGDVRSEDDSELVVCDPWPTAPTACLWEDHFAHTSNRGNINTRNSVTGDDTDVKALIAQGLKLSKKGEMEIQRQLDQETTDKEIEKGTSGDKPWIWSHADSTGSGAPSSYRGPRRQS